MIKSKYFSEAEMQRCTPPCSLQDMSQRTMTKADKLRELCGFPLICICAYRSREWDLAKGRSGNGAHPHRHGLDFRCTDSAKRFAIITNAPKAGFPRIGISKNYIHVDDDETLPQNVMWHYYD